MHFSVVVLFAASLVSAVPTTKRHNDVTYPSCSTKCFAETPSVCQENDTACLCLDQLYTEQVTKCVTSCCSEEDVKKAEEAATNECKAVGIDLANPFPECGLSCVLNTPSSKCDAGNQGDDKCYCTDNDYIQSVAWCTKKYCQGDDFDTAKYVGEARCRAVGVDISSIDSW